MRTDKFFHRAFLTALSVCVVITASAQAPDAAVPVTDSSPEIPMMMIYALLALAIVQVIFIVSLSSIMRTMSAPGISWWRKGTRAVVLVPLLLLTTQQAQAQAYKGGGDIISSYHLFWWLACINIFLFIFMVAQITLVRTMTRIITGAVEQPQEAVPIAGPTWVERVMRRLTRQAPIEQEQDILMHHEYDGIRELDNVLPPWWLWLFYGSVVFAVVYMVNIYVISIWPDQKTEYTNEMAQAKMDVTAYLATLKNNVDENSANALTDAASLASGSSVFHQYCVTCHGQNGEGNVGPNFTDDYWLHGGGIKNIFHTITFGVPEKGMISWKSQLKPTEIEAVASYILGLRGTHPPNPKAAQGDLWKEAATDSTASPLDSTVVKADTLKMAAK